jgi:hypothetical protein
VSPDSDAVSLPNTCCLHFEFRHLYSADRVDLGYGLGLREHWLWPSLGMRASDRILPTPLTPSSTGHSASSGRHRDNRPTPGSPRSNLQLRRLLLRLLSYVWAPPSGDCFCINELCRIHIFLYGGPIPTRDDYPGQTPDAVPTTAKSPHPGAQEAWLRREHLMVASKRRWLRTMTIHAFSAHSKRFDCRGRMPGYNPPLGNHPANDSDRNGGKQQ